MARRLGETSYKETAFGIIPRSQIVPLEVEGIQRAWNFILRTTKPRTQITSLLLNHIHNIGFGWIFPEMGGKFRRVELEVSLHKPPAFYRVPALMEDFCLDLKERLKHLPELTGTNFLSELVRLLTWAHHRFLWIHPFQDYNGRLARLLTNVILLKLELPPIELRVETLRGRKSYVQALQEADRGDMEKLEKLMRQALHEAIQELER